jgi:hypothetical protein
VFTRSGTTWTQQGPKLVGTGGGKHAWQGDSVALSDDGNTALVGGPNASSGPSIVGAAWVFTRSRGRWTQQGAVLLGTVKRYLGSIVALSGDGNTALVGGGRGATRVFVR